MFSNVMKAAGEVGMKWMTDVYTVVVNAGRIPENWSKNCSLIVYTGEEDALGCGSYRGMTLIEHAMKVLESH